MCNPTNTLMALVVAILLACGCEPDNPEPYTPLPPIAPGPPPPLSFKANAGPDLMLYIPFSTATLDGSSSQDNQRVVISYSWEQIIAPGNNVRLANSWRCEVYMLDEGLHTFRLVALDRNGNTSADTMQVTVIDNFAVGIAPTLDNLCDTLVKASDENEYLLYAQAYVDSGGHRYYLKSGYSFTQLSGPSQAVISTRPGEKSNLVQLENVVRGNYMFKVEVTRKGMKTSGNLMLSVAQDTAKGKEYIFESVWKEMTDPFGSNTYTMAQVPGIQGLLPSKANRVLRVWVATEGNAEWTAAGDDWFGGNPLWYMSDCGDEIFVVNDNGSDRSTINKKVRVKVAVVN